MTTTFNLPTNDAEFQALVAAYQERFGSDELSAIIRLRDTESMVNDLNRMWMVKVFDLAGQPISNIEYGHYGEAEMEFSEWKSLGFSVQMHVLDGETWYRVHDTAGW